MKKLLFFLLILLANQVTAQELIVHGKVLDKKTNTGLAGVSIRLEKSRKNATLSDAEGNFSLKIPNQKGILLFSLIGYESFRQEIIPSENKDAFLISMTESENELDEVLVKGLSREQAEAREIRLNVNPVTVITAREIENRASNLNELLARQAGVQVRQSGGAGSTSTVSVRGLEGKRVQIFIDGNPLNTPDGSFGINDLPLQLIERIEVYKGTVPAHLGGDGLGSAINVVLKHREYSYIDGNIALQSFGTVNGGLILKKTFEKQGIEFGIGGFINKSDNTYLMQSPFQPDLKIRRDHDYYRNILVGTSIKFHKLWFDEVEVEGAYVDYSRELQGIQQNIQHVTTTSSVKVIVLGLEKKDFFLKNLSFKSHQVLADFAATMVDTSAYMYNWDGTRIKSRIGRGEMGVGPNNLITKQLEFRSRQNFNYALNKNLNLNLNNAFRRGSSDPKDDVANDYVGRNIYNWPANLTNNVLGLTLEAKSKKDKLMASASVKHYYSLVNGYNTNIYLTKDPDLATAKFSKLGYNLGMRYNLGPDFFLKGSHERALRLPSNQELFGDGVLITPAITLRPEVAFNYNVGLVFDKFRYRTGNRFQIEWNAFLMNVSDLIQLGGNGLSTGYVNYAKARIIGTDIEIKNDFTKNLFGSINATWQRVEDVNRYIPGTQGVANPTYGLLIPNIPTTFANWNLEYHTKGLLGENSRSRFIYEGSYTHQFNFGFAISVYDNLRIPSFLTHNLIWEQAFQKDRWTLTTEVRNLTDAVVINNWNQPLPGRSFRVKLRFLLIDKEKLHAHQD